MIYISFFKSSERELYRPTSRSNWTLWVQLLLEVGPRGGTLIFSYMRRLGPFFGVKILNFNIFWGFQKNKYFLGCEDFVVIFLGSSQNWTIFWGHFYAF